MCAMPDSTAPQRTRESLTSGFHTVCLISGHDSFRMDGSPSSMARQWQGRADSSRCGRTYSNNLRVRNPGGATLIPLLTRRGTATEEYFEVESFAAAFQNVDVTVVASGAPLTSAANCGFTQVG